jgi:hypothetical protein
MKMEAICSSETSVNYQRTARRYISEDRRLPNHRFENLSSYMLICSSSTCGYYWSFPLHAGYITWPHPHRTILDSEEHVGTTRYHNPEYSNVNTSRNISVAFSLLLLDDQGIWVRVPVGARIFTTLMSFRPALGTHSASYPMRTGGCLPRGKATRAWSWPLTPN